MTDALPLNRFYLELLTAFFEAGGVGTLDIHRNLKVGHVPVPGGDPGSCMVLVARGYLAGEGNVLMLTEAGREAGEAEIKGRTRSSV